MRERKKKKFWNIFINFAFAKTFKLIAVVVVVVAVVVVVVVVVGRSGGPLLQSHRWNYVNVGNKDH